MWKIYSNGRVYEIETNISRLEFLHEYMFDELNIWVFPKARVISAREGGNAPVREVILPIVGTNIERVK